MGKQNINQEVGHITGVHTYNVRGLRDIKKRSRVFSHIKNNLKGIVFLQETYAIPGDFDKWKTEWGGNLYLSCGTVHSKGVAILLPKDMEYDIELADCDDDGRYILLVGTFEGHELALLNVYAPTADKTNEQIACLDKISPLIEQYYYKLIMAGDFNTALCEYDKYGTFNNPSIFANNLNTLMEDLDLMDVWRVLNPETRRYTWRSLTRNRIKQSRLDYIVIPTSLLYKINNVEIRNSLYSDHNPVSMSIEALKKASPGRGYWKFNTSLLRDPEYVRLINNVLDHEIEKYANYKNKGLVWDTIKMEIRSNSISYSSHKAKKTKQYEKELSEEIKKVEASLAENPNEDLKQHYITATKELEMINNERAKGSQIRARVTHIKFNEQPNSYFFNKEKANMQVKNITVIQDENGTEIKDPDKIMECQAKFYRRLYTAPKLTSKYETNDANRYFLELDDVPMLNDMDKQSIDDIITFNEITAATKLLPNSKSPGLDGIPVEFYKFFWSKIGPSVFNSIIYAVETGCMSIDQRRGVLSLIPKKDKDVRQLKNWRPLTLLNIDYKIFAKAMASRLQSVIPSVVSNDQSGCIKGRSTFSNIRSTIDIIAHTQEKNIHGALLYIDFEKAFDTVSWEFMYMVLERMNFGQYFRSCVQTMYNNIYSCVMNNGHLSTFFSPTRGIRQGCPISANIFVLIVEILAHAIRKNPQIRGIFIDQFECKISQYADDTCLYVADLHSIRNALLVFERFAKCSGLKINRDKSEAIWIGASSNFRHKPYGLRWTEGATYLGVYISNDMHEMSEKNFRTKMQKIEEILKLWTLRKLTLRGKVTVVNTLIMSQFLYPCSVMNIPTKYIEEYKKIIVNFIWDNKPPKIKYKAMINKIEEGGLKLQDLESKIKSLKIKWIKNIWDETYNSPWKAYLNSKFKMDIGSIIQFNISEDELPIFIDGFYTHMFQTWATLHIKEPETAEEICRQSIWHNTFIRVGRKTICYKRWLNSNINYIQDILDRRGKIMKQTELENKYNFRTDFLQYGGLIKAIPAKWKKIIEENKTLNLNYYVFKECVIHLNNRRLKIEEVDTKEVYWHLISTINERPTSQSKWNEKLDFLIDEPMWELIYCNYKNLTSDTRILNLQFKIIHRLLACNFNLKIWKIKDSNQCSYCEEIDTIEHYLVYCENTYNFWKMVFNWWANNLRVYFNINTYEIVFGVPNERLEPIVCQINYIILHAKYYIHSKKQAGKALDIYEFLVESRNNIRLKYEIMAEADKGELFMKLWGDLHESLS
jgi:exonuclease III